MRSDFDGRAVARTIATEAGSLALQSLMFGFGFLPSQHQPLRKKELRTTVFVHGLAANRASLFPIQAGLHWQGHRRQLSFSYATAGSMEGLALQLKRRIDREVQGGKIDLVCHSLGGLVARAYLQLLGGDRRVDRYVSIGTPHGGTHMTAWLPTPLVRQMSVGSPFLRHLDEQPAPDVEALSLGAARDLIVLPIDNARAPFGRYARIESVGHTSILLAPETHRQVNTFLERPEQG